MDIRYSDGVRPSGLAWVYDCGTHSAAPALDNALARHRQSSRGILDLLTLSHFDKDHVNGVTRLIAQERVRTLLLPYLSLAQRIAIAFAQGVAPADPAMELFVNPVGFLSRTEGAQIGEFLFVPPSNGEGPRPEEPREPREPREPFEGPDDRPPLDYETEDGKDDPQQELAAMGNAAGGARVSMLRAGGTLRFRDLWEFVPYNDARYAPLADASFIDTAWRAAGSLLKAAGSAAARQALDALKSIYDQRFKKWRRNEISLFLYGGATRRSEGWTRTALTQRARTIDDRERLSWTESEFRTTERRHGVLYTGDGLLDTPARLEELLDYLGKSRVANFGVVQVMHHGSSQSWHEGVARALAPDVSMFCADPAHEGYGHPHGEVVRDFLPYGSRLTDLDNEWLIHFDRWDP